VLHGDLWSGNIGSADGQPTVYDPAVYYGHHEVPPLPVQPANAQHELRSTDCAVMAWCSLKATQNHSSDDTQWCASFCGRRLSLVCPGALALAAHSGQPTMNSYHEQKVSRAPGKLASFLVMCAHFYYIDVVLDGSCSTRVHSCRF
jgi:Fructosamine kinase